MKKLSGITVPIVTPFNEDGTIDVESLRKLTEYVIKSGLTCLYPCGTTGEMLFLNNEERKLISETVVAQAAGRVPVFVQAGAMNLKDTISLAQHAVSIGADGIGVVTPSYFKLSDDALVDFYMEVAQSVPKDFSVYLYAIPQNAVNDINVSVAQQIADKCPNVVGIKYSYPNMSLLQKFMLVNDESFSVLVGPDDLFHVVCAAGGDGTVSGNAQVIPEHYTALWKAIQSGDNAEARKLQRSTNVLNNILCEKNNISAYKVVLREEGIIKNAGMRAPMKGLSKEEETALMDALNQHHYKEVIA
jgi:4-hydroxy-tetrahydrodipicolinate synthase